MADRTSSSVTIAAAPDSVLHVVADLHRYPEWNAEIKSVEVLDSEPGGRPTRARFTISSTGMTDEYTLDYEWAPDGVRWRLAEPSTLQKTQVGSYALSAAGDGTLVTYDLTIESRIPMIGPMRRKIEKRIVDAALKELKKRVESLG